MINVYKTGDTFVWIPVSIKNGKDPRAFLPWKGLNGSYRFGYKAEPETASYFEALAKVQACYLKKLKEESKKFWVNKGEKQENQYCDKWRHENGSSLLTSSGGWVKIPISRLKTVQIEELASALSEGKTKFAEIPEIKRIKPIPCNSAEELEAAVIKLKSIIFDEKPIGQKAPQKLTTHSEKYVRDAAVVAYVLNIAKNVCECCNKAAPFQKCDGSPYLEVHHVKRLADEGSDTIENAVAVCPNCHRELHYGKNKLELVENLYKNIQRLVRE